MQPQHIVNKSILMFRRKGKIMSSYTKERKPVAFTVIGIIIIAILAIAIIGVISMSIMFKGDNSAPSIFGWNIYIMDTDQMEPEIPNGAAVFAKSGPLDVGNPVGTAALCKLSGGELTTIMRIVNTEIDESGRLTYWVRFDKQPSDTAQIIYADSVIGQAKYYSVGWGNFIRFAVSPTGILCIIIIPCAVLALYQIIMIIIRSNNKEAYKAAPVEDIEINEDEYNEFDKDDVPTASSNGELFMKPTAREKKRNLEANYEELAKGFGTHMFDANFQAEKKKADTKPGNVNDVLFNGYRTTKDNPVVKQENLSATEKYGLGSDDEELSFVRKAKDPVSNTKYGEENTGKAAEKAEKSETVEKTEPAETAEKPKTPVRVVVKPKHTAVKTSAPSKPISVSDIKIESVTEKVIENKPAKPVTEKTVEVEKILVEQADTAKATPVKVERAEPKAEQKAETKPESTRQNAPAKSSNQKLEELMALLNMQNK